MERPGSALGALQALGSRPPSRQATAAPGSARPASRAASRQGTPVNACLLPCEGCTQRKASPLQIVCGCVQLQSLDSSLNALAQKLIIKLRQRFGVSSSMCHCRSRKASGNISICACSMCFLQMLSPGICRHSPAGCSSRCQRSRNHQPRNSDVYEAWYTHQGQHQAWNMQGMLQECIAADMQLQTLLQHQVVGCLE